MTVNASRFSSPAGLPRRRDVSAVVDETVTASATAGAREDAEKPWRSCVCPIESDARDGLGLVNVCAILN